MVSRIQPRQLDQTFSCFKQPPAAAAASAARDPIIVRPLGSSFKTAPKLFKAGGGGDDISRRGLSENFDLWGQGVRRR